MSMPLSSASPVPSRETLEQSLLELARDEIAPFVSRLAARALSLTDPVIQRPFDGSVSEIRVDITKAGQIEDALEVIAWETGAPHISPGELRTWLRAELEILAGDD